MLSRWTVDPSVWGGAVLNCSSTRQVSFPLSLLICYQFRINHKQYLLAINNLTSIALCALQGNLEEGLKRFQELIDQNPRDFRPYICQVNLSASQLWVVHTMGTLVNLWDSFWKSRIAPRLSMDKTVVYHNIAKIYVHMVL